MAVVNVKAERFTLERPFYQIRIMDPEISVFLNKYKRDIDFWLWNGLGWVRGRNAQGGDWG